MLFGGGLLGLLAFGLWVFCIFDVISSAPDRVRNLPKLLWLLLVVFLFDIGALAWLFLGRPQREPAAPRPEGDRPVRRRPLGPDDDPNFNARVEDFRRRQAGEQDL